MTKHKAWKWLWRRAPGWVFKYFERLERDGGSVALTGLADAKRADEPGRAEDEGATRPTPQSLAVSPGQAQAAINQAIALVREEAALFDHCASAIEKDPEHWEEFRNCKRRAAALRQTISVLMFMRPETASEQRGKEGDVQTTPWFVRSRCTPSNGTASGRRNAKG